MQYSDQLGNTFTRSWELLTRNWIIIVPAIVIAVVAGIVIAVLGMFGMTAAVGLAGSGMGQAGVGSMMMTAAIIGAIVLIASILTIAYTTGMAEAAWRTGTATLEDGTAAFREDAGSIVIAMVELFIIGVIATFLSVFTFGLALLAFWLLFIYTFASVVVGKHSGTDALAESARITGRNFVTTLVIVVLLAIAFFIAAWIGGVLHHVPFIGPIVSYIINQIVAAFATLVVVGEYRNLRSVGTAAPPPPTATSA